jgi:hypothetical protein
MSRARRAARLVFAPLLLYLACFVALTYPLVTRFSTHLWVDDYDGYQHAWCVWWIDHALVHLHRAPYWVGHLTYPATVPLLLLNAHPFDALLAVPLLRALTLVETTNALLLFGFVASGLTAFWLARAVSGSTVGALVGGFAFAFSGYHFAHAEGHLSLVAMEWLPLAALASWRFARAPSVLRALAVAGALLFTILCDYYYFVFSAMLFVILLIAQSIAVRDPLHFLRRALRRPLLAFALAATAATGPIALALLRANHQDPLLGAHPAAVYSLDLFALLIPGGHWRFAALTAPYWSRVTGGVNESSVHIGLAGALAALYVFRRRRALDGSDVGRWLAAACVFALLALGPVLHVWGRAVPHLPMPYALLQLLAPPLELSGCPVRMAAMVTLVMAVVWACAVRLLAATRRGRLVAAALVGLLALESLPRPLTTTATVVPPVYQALLAAQGPGAIADVVTPPPRQMWMQTLHERPIVFGYLARTPASVAARQAGIAERIRHGDADVLHCADGLRFVVVPPSLPWPGAPIFRDDKAKLYDLAALPCE